MKINGEEIISFDIRGEETGYLKTNIKTLTEVYEILKDHKEYVKRIKSVKDKYYINCNTKTTTYGGYELKKYKDKLYLK